MTLELSIVISSYDRSSELKDLFQSILEQTTNPLEIIIVDDTPSREIEHLVKEWKKKFAKANVELTYIRNPRKRSITVARNVGIEIARGDIILFLDTDVYIYPHYNQKILEVFEDNPRALGAQGWVINYYTNRLQLRSLIYATIFRTFYPSKNSCKFGEYPIVLDSIINCDSLLGANMAYRRQVFGMGFRFDENLEKYAFMEDLLLSYTLYKMYPGSLFITPYATCVHRESQTGRERNFEQMNLCRKYVLRKLFGKRGLILYCWQTFGSSMLRLTRLLRARSSNLLG